MSEPRMIAERYRLDRVLGQGAMGQVWLGYDLLIHRPVAVKQVLAAADPTTRERALREAQAAGRMQHRNAVAVYDLVVIDGLPWVVMEYVAGESLADRLDAAGTLPVHVVADVAEQVAAALASAHRMGIVHRDVKPANILIDAEGTAKLADFGIARMEAQPELTGTGLVIGTVSFLPPEIARGANASAAADIWSLGASMFLALEGRPVFTGPNSYAIIAALAQDPVPAPVRSGPLTGLLTRMLSRDPAQRPSAEQVRAQLEPLRAAPTTPIRSAPPSAWPYAPPSGPPVAGPRQAPIRPTEVARAPTRRRRGARLLIAVLAVVVLAAAAGIAYALHDGPSTPSRTPRAKGVSSEVVSGNGERNAITSVRWRSAGEALDVYVHLRSVEQPGDYDLTVEFDTDGDPHNHCRGIDSFIVWSSTSQETTRRIVDSCPMHGSGSFSPKSTYAVALPDNDTVHFDIPYLDELPSAGHTVGMAVSKQALPISTSGAFSVLPGSGSSRDGTIPVRLK